MKLKFIQDVTETHKTKWCVYLKNRWITSLERVEFEPQQVTIEERQSL
jgi:hypothetical protein